ncbi:MAG: LysR substrate-binding domain-containing protein [Rhodoferax sp.]
MRRKIPAIHTLLCFEAAARHESYTRAAQELALTQSAVSRQVAALEEYLGQPLFTRARHGVVLTPRGREYAAQVADRLLALERDTLNAMSTQGTQGAVHLAAVPTFATRWLIPHLPHLQALYPDIVVHIDTRTRPFMFADSGFDVALYAGTAEQVANWAGTHATLLIEEEVVPVCAPDLLGAVPQPVTPEALAALPLLQQSTRPFGWSQWFDAMAAPAPLAMSGPRLELFSMTIAAAIHGLGVALVPRLLVETELARGELVVACDKPLRGERAYYLIAPLGDTESQAVMHFRHWLVAAMAG